MRTHFYVISFIILLFGQSCSSGEDDAINTPDEEITDGNLYFPPLSGDAWETVAISSLGWDENRLQPLFDFLEEKDTQAFLVLKNGKIAIEAYFNGGDASQNYPWFSAGKTLSAFTLGIAQQEGFLTIDTSSANYLGKGWSSLTETEEEQITVWHHLTMTTGLDFTVEDANCTNPDCLTYLNPPGTFWYYHNAPYTLIQAITEGATQQNFLFYFNNRLRNPIGMDGAWVALNFNTIYFSTARSAARFGLLTLNKGNWNGTKILDDEQYFDEMTSTSQALNPAYGYLWWLNGKENYRTPGSTALFNGNLIPGAPEDLIAALGANDQKIYVVPSQNLVIVRLGGNPGEALLGPSGFDTQLWEKINDLIN
jgi:CubicO group peptidase (beta-lactamase class C family)